MKFTYFYIHIPHIHQIQIHSHTHKITSYLNQIHIISHIYIITSYLYQIQKFHNHISHLQQTYIHSHTHNNILLITNTYNFYQILIYHIYIKHTYIGIYIPNSHIFKQIRNIQSNFHIWQFSHNFTYKYNLKLYN